MKKLAALFSVFLLTAACATGSTRARIESRFVELGLSADRAGCLAGELDERLERDDLSSVADFLGGLNDSTSPGESLDALLSIDNPRAASAIARAGISCAFN